MALPINFHKTFIPERRLLEALLRYAAEGRSDTYQEVAAATGIPMGKSCGKVPAIIDYARGMGLVAYDSGIKGAKKKLMLTPFGRTVLLEDSSLGEPLTQWLAHAHLCRPNYGALAWNKVFCEGRRVLGLSFTENELETFLEGIFGPGRDRIGPLVRMYDDGAAFGRILAIKREGHTIVRRKAPITEIHSYAYAAYILTVMEQDFSGESQVGVEILGGRAALFDAFCWEPGEVDAALSYMERTDLVSIDRQMRPWIVEKRKTSAEAWPSVYRAIP